MSWLTGHKRIWRTALLALLMGLTSRLHWTLWGLWLYLSTMVLLLALEIMLKRTQSATR